METSDNIIKLDVEPEETSSRLDVYIAGLMPELSR